MSDVVAVYADGGLMSPHPCTEGLVTAFCQVSAGGDIVTIETGFYRPAELGLDVVSSSVAEVLALLNAARSVPAGWRGTFYSDSVTALYRFRDPLRSNYRGIPPPLRLAVIDASRRLGPVNWVQLKGHPSKKELARGVGKSGAPVSLYQVLCDKACNERKKVERSRSAVAAGDEAVQHPAGDLQNEPVQDEFGQ